MLKTSQLHIRIQEVVKFNAQAKAERQGWPLSSIIRTLLKLYAEGELDYLFNKIIL